MKDLVGHWCDLCFNRLGFSTVGWVIYLAVAVPLGVAELLALLWILWRIVNG